MNGLYRAKIDGEGLKLTTVPLSERGAMTSGPRRGFFIADTASGQDDLILELDGSILRLWLADKGYTPPEVRKGGGLA